MVGNDIYLPSGAAIYNLSGAKVSSFNLASGIYIIRFAGGATAKVMVK